MSVKNKILHKLKNLLKETYVDYIEQEYRYITYPGVRPLKYLIGENGLVYNIEKNIIMSQTISNRYLGVTLSKTSIGEYARYSIHRLVAWEFVDGYGINGRTHVNHKDSSTFNNLYNNLEWCTPSENSYHAFNNDHAHSRKRSLSKTEVIRICELFEQGEKIIYVFRIITGLQGKKDDEKTYKKIVRIYTREYYKNISKHYIW